MHDDPSAPIFVAILLAILVLGHLMSRIKQPAVVAYLLVGVVLGPSVLGVVHDQQSLSRLGDIGVILLLFFVGMEVSPKQLVSNWLIAVIGTLLQVGFSVMTTLVLGWLFSWSLALRILLGFVISLSSTSVVLKLLQDWKEIDTRVGQNILGILLVQDLLIIPMMIVLNLFNGSKPSTQLISLQVFGGIVVLAAAIWITIKEKIELPFLKQLVQDSEGSVFVALSICFGLSMVTSLLGLSTALGAFLAGLVVGSTKETQWAHNSLLPLKTIFVALFFVSVGMLVDLSYIWHFFWQISFLVIAAFITNTLINAVILKVLGENWSVSVYQGSLLSQIGEFAFVIAAIGMSSSIINDQAYKMIITTIALTILFSPLWIMLIKHLLNKQLLNPVHLVRLRHRS